MVQSVRSDHDTGRLKKAIEDTVSIFSSLLGTPLHVDYSDKTALSDDKLIIPIGSPFAYEVTEHLLARRYFGTKPSRGEIFCRVFGNTLYRHTYAAAQRGGEDLTAPPYSSTEMFDVQDFISAIVKVLDRRRVNSLWCKLYPGSYANIYAATARVSRAQNLKKASQRGTCPFLDTVEAGVDTTVPEQNIPLFRRFKRLFSHALEMVSGTDYDGVFYTVKWLIPNMVDEYCFQYGWDHHDLVLRSKALLDIITHGMAESSSMGSEPLDSNSSSEESDKAMVAEVLMASRDTIDEFIGGMTEESDQLLDKAITGLYEERPNRPRGEDFRIDAGAGDRETDIGPLADTGTADRLKSVFMRILGRRTTTLDHGGVQIDTEARIQSRIMRGVPFFRAPALRAGFDLVILVDESSSMATADRSLHVSRACQTLARALDFPFVRLTVFGFRGQRDGNTVVTRFTPQSIASGKGLAFAEGYTPIPQAIRAAVSEMRGSLTRKHIIVLTDGEPIYVEKGEIVLGVSAIKATAVEVQAARRAQILVNGLIIAVNRGGVAVTPSDEADLEMMYGPRGWGVLVGDTIGRDLVNTATRMFTRYLRLG